MNPRYTLALYCPLCDVSSRECIDSDEHCAHWETLAERARDIALENYQTNRSALDAQSEPQLELEIAPPPAL